MILTTCAACAAPLAHDAPRCIRCKLRYCDSTCQHDHWRRGHKQMCKKIHRGGNAEQYHADKKYKEAVAVAVEACADEATDLLELRRFDEAKSLLRGTIPIARRVLGESDRITLQMRWNYAVALYKDDGATLNDLHEAVTMLEDTARVARRVFGGAHPTVANIEVSLRNSRLALRDREALLAKYLLYAASALAIAAFAFAQRSRRSR